MTGLARRAALVVGVVLVLTACASARPAPTSPDTAVGLPDWIDSRCSAVGAAAPLADFWGQPAESSGYDQYGPASVWKMQGSALIQAGALVCVWETADDESSALLIAMGDGADGFHRSEASFADAASGYTTVGRWDGAHVSCRTDGLARCHWNVLSGTTWISVLVGGVPADDLVADDLAATGSADVVAALVDGVLDVAPEPPASGSDAWSCASTLTPERVAEVLDVEPSRLGASAGVPVDYALGFSTPDFGQTMWAYAQEHLGYRECHLSLDGERSASIVSAPDGAWLFDDFEGLVGVGSFGQGLDHCETEGDFTLCTVSLTRGDDLVVVQMPASSTEELARSQAAAIAAIVVG